LWFFVRMDHFRFVRHPRVIQREERAPATLNGVTTVERNPASHSQHCIYAVTYGMKLPIF
jgi:hypothetical protein